MREPEIGEKVTVHGTSNRGLAGEYTVVAKEEVSTASEITQGPPPPRRLNRHQRRAFKAKHRKERKEIKKRLEDAERKFLRKRDKRKEEEADKRCYSKEEAPNAWEEWTKTVHAACEEIRNDIANEVSDGNGLSVANECGNPCGGCRADCDQAQEGAAPRTAQSIPGASHLVERDPAQDGRRSDQASEEASKEVEAGA